MRWLHPVEVSFAVHDFRPRKMQRVGGAVQRGDEGRDPGDKESHLQGGGGRLGIGEGQGAPGPFHRPPHGTGEENYNSFVVKSDVVSGGIAIHPVPPSWYDHQVVPPAEDSRSSTLSTTDAALK